MAFNETGSKITLLQLLVTFIAILRVTLQTFTAILRVTLQSRYSRATTTLLQILMTFTEKLRVTLHLAIITHLFFESFPSYPTVIKRKYLIM